MNKTTKMFLAVKSTLYALFFFGFILQSCHKNAVGKSADIGLDTKRIVEINSQELPTGTDVLAIVGAKLIDGTGAPPIEDSCILIKGNTIAAVGQKSNMKIPDGAKIFSAEGLTLIPGLIDAHFHYDFVKGFPTVFVKNGITSVRDPGQWIEAYDEERNAGTPLPRLFLTGPHIEMFPSAYPNDAYIVRDNLEVKEAVGILSNQGASAIKIYYRLSKELIREVCAEADKYGLPVTGHLGTVDAIQAIEMGLDGIEHITSLGTSLVSKKKAESYRHVLLSNLSNTLKDLETQKLWGDIDPGSSLADSLLNKLTTRGIYVTPTLGALESTDSIGRIAFENMKTLVGICHEKGVKLTVGSHGPWVPFAPKGWSYQYEMELMVDSGMDPLSVIAAGTSENARFLKIFDRLGSLETGKLADLVLVKGDPLKDIRAMYNIEAVMLNGIWLDK